MLRPGDFSLVFLLTQLKSPSEKNLSEMAGRLSRIAHCLGHRMFPSRPRERASSKLPRTAVRRLLKSWAYAARHLACM
jgi:hypothetical protein